MSSLNYCVIQPITFHPLTSYCLFLYDLKIDTLVKLKEKEAVTWVNGFHMVVHRATGFTVGNSCSSSCIKASRESELITEIVFDHLNQLRATIRHLFSPQMAASQFVWFLGQVFL